MEKIVLKIGKQEVIDCYKKNQPLIRSFERPFCSTMKALEHVEGAVNGCFINYCKYASECARLRRKL